MNLRCCALAVFLLGMLYAVPSAFSQYATAKVYNTDNGLPHYEVLDVEIDKQGCLWIAQGFAILKYDGKNFIPVKQSPAGAYYLNQDFDEGIIATGTGILDPVNVHLKNKTLHFSRYTSARYPAKKFLKDSLPEGYPVNGPGNKIFFFQEKYPEQILVYAFQSGREGFSLVDSINAPDATEILKAFLSPFSDNWLVLTKNPKSREIEFYFFKGGTYRPVPLPFKILESEIPGLIPIYGENLVINYPGKGFFYYHGKVWQPLNQALNEEYAGSANVHVSYSYIDRHLLIVLSNRDKHTIFDFRPDLTLALKSSFKFYSKPLSAAKDRGGNYWVATHGGLVKVYPAMINYFVEENQDMLSDIHTVREDAGGKIWIGSYGRGWCYVENGRIHQPPASMAGFLNILPGSYTDASGNLWFISEDPQSRGLKVFKKEQGKVHTVFSYPLGYFIQVDDQGRMLYGSSAKGLFIERQPGCGLDSVCWKRIGPEKGFSLTNVLSAVQDRQGRYWMGRRSTGLAVYLPDRDTVYSFLIDKGQTRYGFISSLRDFRGNVWLGTNRGLALLTPPDVIDHRFRPDEHISEIDSNLLGRSVPLSMTVYQDSLLAMVNETGFYLLNLKAYYRSGKLYIQSFDRYTGYHGGAGDQNAICVDRRNRIWFANDHGVTCFDPFLYQADTTIPQVYIDSLSSFGDVFPLPDGKPLRLERKHRNIRIFFHSSANSSLLDNITFMYRLNEGTFRNSRQDSVEFLNLAPGKYDFQVYAVKNGIASETAILQFSIPLPLYQQPFFLLGLMALVTGTGAIAYRRKQLLEKRRRELISLRVQTIINQLNPHFMNNILSWIQLRAHTAKDEDVVSVVGKLGENINIIFRNSRERRLAHTLEEEMTVVRNYFRMQQARFPGRIICELPAEEHLERWGKEIYVPIMCLQIHCENAIEHGIRNKETPGLVRLIMREKAHYLSFIIEDDGIGRAKAREIGSKGTQQGTRMLDELIRIFNFQNTESITQVYEDGIFTAPGGDRYGTRVIINIPKKYNYGFSDFLRRPGG